MCIYIYLSLSLSICHTVIHMTQSCVIYLSHICHAAPALPTRNIKHNAANSKVNPAISKWMPQSQRKYHNLKTSAAISKWMLQFVTGDWHWLWNCSIHFEIAWMLQANAAMLQCCNAATLQCCNAISKWMLQLQKSMPQSQSQYRNLKLNAAISKLTQHS